jgi:hypothetical protein
MSTVFQDLFITGPTLTVLEVLWYTGCSQTVTAIATVLVDGTTFTANEIKLAFASPDTPIEITYNFPNVTLASVTPGEIIEFVFPLFKCSLTSGRLNHRRKPELVGRWHNCVSYLY